MIPVVFKEGWIIVSVKSSPWPIFFQDMSSAPSLPASFPLSLPTQTFAPVPNFAAALSVEALSFGRLGLNSKSTRITILVNYSTEYVLSYRWDSRGLFRSDEEAEFKIVPAQVIRVFGFA